jgi:hypothetical protein
MNRHERRRNYRNPDNWNRLAPKLRLLVKAGIFPPDADPMQRLMLAVCAMLKEGKLMHKDTLYTVCNEVYKHHHENFEAAVAAVVAGQHPLIELAPNDYAVGGISSGIDEMKVEDFARAVHRLLDSGRVRFEDGYYSVVSPKPADSA